jgi:PAS domain S-box-containing protein
VLLDAIKVGAVTLTPEGIVRYANPHFAGMLRLSLEQVIDGPFGRFLPEGERAAFETLVNAAREGAQEGTIHLRRAWADDLPVRLSCRFLDDPDLRALCLVFESSEPQAHEALRQATEELEARVAVRTVALAEANRALQEGNLSLEELNAQLEEEVLQRQQIATALQVSEEKFRRVFESSPDPILLFSLHSGQVLDVNAAFERITGYERAEILNRNILRLEILPDAEQRAHLLQELAEQGVVRGREITLRKKSSELVAGFVACSMVDVAAERMIVAVFQDIADSRWPGPQAAPRGG